MKLARQLSKGNRVNIPEPGHGDLSSGAMCGNANEVGDVGGSPGKSFLFFVRSPIPGIGLPGDRDLGSVKHRSFAISDAFSRAIEHHTDTV